MENKILDFIQPQSTITLISKTSSKDVINDKEKKIESFSKILRFFAIKFLQIYGIRIAYSFIKLLLSINKKGIKGISFDLILQAIFNMPNLKTAGFVSLLSGLFRLLNHIFKLLGKENIFTCFISGLISSLIGIFIEEKTELVTFIILSTMVRTIYSLIIVLADRYKWPNYPRTANTLVFIVACIGFLFIAFCHPSFKSINKLFLNYANFQGSEKQEIEHYMSIVRIV